MKLKLTDREIALLGWDEPDARDDPETIRAILAKRDGRAELSETETARVLFEVRYLPGPGEADPATTRTASRLRNKVYDQE